MLRESWWIVALGLVVGMGVGLGLSLASTPQYTSGSRLFVSSTTNSSSTSEALQGSQFSENRLDSYAALLSDEALAARVVNALALPLTPVQLADKVDARAVSGTVLLDYTVTDPSPQRAQRIATEVGRQFVALVRDLETPNSTVAPPIKVTVLRAPDLPSSPSSPHTVRNVLVGAAFGLVLGVGLALARTRLDQTIRDADVVAELTSAPTIGVIVEDPVLLDRHVFDRDASSPAAEGYRRLRANLQFLHVDEPPKVILVSSAVPGEGKTTLAINLGLALVEAGRQVVIVDADLRRPRVTRYLSMVGGVGLTNVLTGQAELADVLQKYGAESLSVLGAGPTPPNPSQLVASSNMASVVDDLAAKHDYVILDAPPVLPVADATSLAVLADGVVLSVRYGSTRKELVRRTMSALDQVGATILGVVMNIVSAKAAVSEGYGYRYDSDRA